MDITVPERKAFFEDNVSVPIAPKGASWYQKCLGDLASEKGVYVITHRNSIMYVGKTDGNSMSFGMRLRRHFQESAAGSKHTYPKLSRLHSPPSIKVKMFPLNEIKGFVEHNVANSNDLHLISLFEAALILALKPKFQC